MKVLGIVQARMNSSRLPGKVLMDIGGRTMLARVLRRAGRANFMDRIIVATPDANIRDFAHEKGFASYLGDEEDVLDRFYSIASAFSADAVVRICADNPLVDPWLIDFVIKRFKEMKADYAKNTEYPLGLSIEVMTIDILRQVWEEAREDYERVHVTPYIFQHPEKFKCLKICLEKDLSHHRWTVDMPKDFEFMREVYQQFGDSDSFGWRDVLAMLNKNPSLSLINAHIRQKGIREC